MGPTSGKVAITKSNNSAILQENSRARVGELVILIG